jgi:hypothetical protein
MPQKGERLAQIGVAGPLHVVKIELLTVLTLS